jgi:hypothetical protein
MTGFGARVAQRRGVHQGGRGVRERTAGGQLQQWTCSSADPAQSFQLLPTS